uniref:Keratin n=1 Tax=Chelonoidis abingdonii TaxID=106734 RepID=A0A8C0QQ47_CHEAB
MFQIYLHYRKISCFTNVCSDMPQSMLNSCNKPDIRQCSDSEVVIRPSPVVVTLPGPILSIFPQHCAVGAVGAPLVGPSFGGSYSWEGLWSGSCGPC